MYIHDHQERIRYADTDQMGFVYYGKYATFYEIGRVETLRSLGHSYKKLEDAGMMMPVLEVHSKFLSPARYDELITIRTIIPELPKVKIRFEHQIFSEKGNLIHEGTTILVFIHAADQKPIRFPESVLMLLQPYFQQKT